MQRIDVTISGDKGAGKTTLAQNFANALRKSGMNVELFEDGEPVPLEGCPMPDPRHVVIHVVQE